MVRSWIESVFIKRVALATAAAFVAHWTAQQAVILHHLSVWGITAVLHIDQSVFADHLTIVLVGLSQGLHEWIAVKFPELGKYL